MRSGAGAVPTGGRGWGRSWPLRNPLWVPHRPVCIHHQARSHPSATCAVGLVGIPRIARYDNAYYQTMGPSLAGWCQD
jgi:hypothetical protein